MKGTLFSADFVQDSNDNLRLLEINTDTGFYSSALTHFDYTGLHNIISSSNIVNLHVISKGFQDKFVTAVSQSVAAEGVITNFTNTVEENYTIYPTVVTDAADKFILRLAYDESTVFDSTYCKNNNEVTSLFVSASDQDAVAEAWHSSSAEIINTLDYSVNGDDIPDFVIKDATESGKGVEFIKVQGDGTDFENINYWLGSIGPDAFVTNFYNTSGTHQKSFRSYNIVYGTDLELINLADLEIPALFEKPTSLTLSGSLVDDKHFYEFSTNYPFFQPKDGYGGIFEEESITALDGTAVPVVSASVGTAYKSYFISGSPDTDLVSEFGDWSYAGSTLPAGSYETSSLLTNSVPSTVYRKLVCNVVVDGGHSIRLSGNQHLLTYDSGSDELVYKEAYQIDENTDHLLRLDGTTIDITSNSIEILEDDHKVYLLDMEEVDTYLVHEAGINMKVVAHNACFPAGTSINLVEEGETKLIENFEGGENVITYDVVKKEFSSARVEKLKSSTQTDLLEIATETDEVIKCTKGHKMYTSEGWRDANELREGDYLLNSLGNLTAITKITLIEGEFEVYHLMNVGSEHTYFANDILVHNYSRAVSCFVDGTEVTLANGDVKNIEDVEQRDEVLTLNEKSGQQESKTVYGVISAKHNDIIEYTLEDGTKVSSTYDHPYFVDGLALKAFNPDKTASLYGLEVEKIEIGDVLIKVDGSKSAIKDIDAGLLDADIQTTTLRIEDNHNFYANGILVHNK